MAPHHPHLVPPALTARLAVSRPCFTTAVWNHILVLLAGAVSAPGKRTVTQALRVMGLAEEPSFRCYHEVLSRARRDARAVARRLLPHVLDRLLPDAATVYEYPWPRCHGTKCGLDQDPSVPTMMRQLPPGSLDPKARKDHLAYAHAAHTK